MSYVIGSYPRKDYPSWVQEYTLGSVEVCVSSLAMWFPSVGMFGVVLAVVGAIVSILAFTGGRRIGLALLFGLLGVGELVSIHRADTAHDTEVHNQHDDIENLRDELRKSDTERQVAEAYLKAKLEDSYQMNAQLSQLGPGLLKLAQVSADFEKKQYEAKTTSNKELYDFTMGVVKKIRDFSEKYQALRRQQSDALMVSAKEPQSDAERQRRWSEWTQKEIQLDYSRDSEFRASILPDALYAKSELQKKGIPEPNLTPRQKSDVDIVLRGVLAGVYPEQTLADYLELRAKEIPLK